MRSADSQRLRDALAAAQHTLDNVAAMAGLAAAHRRFCGTPRAMAERLLLERRKRDALFPADLFGEPAWDLLLALFIARDEDRSMTVAEAYGAAGVAPAAGRTLLAKLEESRLITRCSRSRRRNADLINLTDEGAERLVDFLAWLL